MIIEVCDDNNKMICKKTERDIERENESRMELDGDGEFGMRSEMEEK